MASKIQTDDPKHHAYTCVNKRERKKVKRGGAKLPLLTLLAREILHLLEHTPFRWHSYTTGPRIPPGTVIIWDDCNHTTYRKAVKENHSFQMVTSKRFPFLVRTFKKPYSCEF